MLRGGCSCAFGERVVSDQRSGGKKEEHPSLVFSGSSLVCPERSPRRATALVTPLFPLLTQNRGASSSNAFAYNSCVYFGHVNYSVKNNCRPADIPLCRKSVSGLPENVGGKGAPPVLGEKAGLEDATELEEPFLMPGVADAAAKEDGAEGGFGDESPDDIRGEPGDGKGIIVHFAKFTRTGEIDLFADECREGEDLVEIATAHEEILIAEQFVQAIGAQDVGAAEEKGGRRANVAKAKRGAAARGEKK